MARRCRAWRGFTLIEVLVVIAVIAVLVSMLLPALKQARLAGQTVRCLSNMRQITIAANTYAMDYKEQIWPVANRASWPNGARVYPPPPDPTDPDSRNVALWAQAVVDGKRAPGFLYQYCANAHEITSCPTNKRRAINGSERLNMWASYTGVDFDYTMLDELEGLRLSTQVFVGWVQPGSGLSFNLGPAAKVVQMRGAPLFFEESTRWYNQQYRDAMFGNADQMAMRHAKGGHIGYVDTSCELFKPPMGPREDLEETADWRCYNMYINRRGSPTTWYSISDDDWRFGRNQGYGWANDPR